MDLLSQLRLSLLDSGHDHVSDTTSGQSVQTGTNTLHGDDVEVSGTGVVGAVHDGTAVGGMLVGQGSGFGWGFEVAYTGRPRVILSLPPGAPRLYEHRQSVSSKFDPIHALLSAKSDAHGTSQVG